MLSGGFFVVYKFFLSPFSGYCGIRIGGSSFFPVLGQFLDIGSCHTTIGRHVFDFTHTTGVRPMRACLGSETRCRIGKRDARVCDSLGCKRRQNQLEL